MSDLLKLAERCEAATKPDRELDTEICKAIAAYPSDWQTRLRGYSLGYFISWSGCALPYTASIDAAMQLVPEGMEVALYWGTPGFKPNAQLENEAMRRRFEFEPHNGEAATPALALCAAALRARSQS